jgi:DNA repair protein RecO (recombination protein O)
MIHTTQLIVLHTIKYTESSLLLYAYTHLFGRQTYLLRGVRTVKNHSAVALFFPLHILDAEVYYKPSANLQHIKEYRATSALHGIRTNLYKNVIALFLGELLYKTIKEEESNPLLFQFLVYAIKELDVLTEGVANFHLHFITHYCAHLGFAPTLNFHPQLNPVFDIFQGSFVPIGTAPALALSKEESALLYQFYTAPNASAAATIPLHSAARNRYIDSIIRYLSYHLNAPLVLNAPAVLRQIFQ